MRSYNRIRWTYANNAWIVKRIDTWQIITNVTSRAISYIRSTTCWYWKYDKRTLEKKTYFLENWMSTWTKNSVVIRLCIRITKGMWRKHQNRIVCASIVCAIYFIFSHSNQWTVYYNLSVFFLLIIKGDDYIWLIDEENPKYWLLNFWIPFETIEMSKEISKTKDYY